MRKIVQIRDVDAAKRTDGLIDASFLIENPQYVKYFSSYDGIDYAVVDTMRADLGYFFQRYTRYIECGFILEF